MPETSFPFEIVERAATLAADDDTLLGGTWFTPAAAQPEPSTSVVLTGGAGIPARRYHRLARYLAQRGAAVLAFDYRGVGASRTDSLRTMRGGMDDWAARDIGAALAAADAAYPGLPLCAVAHSVGALLLGAAPGASRIAKCVFLGGHTGYWRDYGVKWRWALFFVWHGFMPAMTRVVGYFPGHAFRLGEDLPPQVAYDWANRRQPALVRTQRDGRRFGPHLQRYASFRADTLAISISDDAFAPPGATMRLLTHYPGIDATRETVTPESLGRPRLGHFGFIRKETGEYFWRRIAEWFSLRA